MFSRVPALCSSAAAWAVCARIYSSVCVRVWQTELWFFFYMQCFATAVKPGTELQRKRQHPPWIFHFLFFFLKQILFLLLPMKSNLMASPLSPPVLLFFLNLYNECQNPCNWEETFLCSNSILALTAHSQVAAGGLGRGGRDQLVMKTSVLNPLMDGALWDT